jgi:hypothetical protein
MKHQRIPLSRAYPKASHARREDQAVPYKYRAPGTREGGRKQWKKNRVKKKTENRENGREKEPEQNTKKKNIVQRLEEEGTKGRNKSRRPSFPSNERLHQSSLKMLAITV